MVDTPLILRKLSQLREFTAQLEEYQTVTAGQYAAEWKTQRIIERTLQMAIEVCLDVAGHIISEKGYRIPNSYADHFNTASLRLLIRNRIPWKQPVFDTSRKTEILASLSERILRRSHMTQGENLDELEDNCKNPVKRLNHAQPSLVFAKLLNLQVA